uniref:Midkine and pleiotrophin isoform a n=1 Tax=Triatoma infestans TaxID=30076 RepID=A0A170W4V5_TRIIF
MHFFCIVFVGSHVVDVVPSAFFFSVNCLDLVLVFASHSDQGPFSYRQGSLLFLAPRSLRINTSFSSSSQISPSASTTDANNTTATRMQQLHFIFNIFFLFPQKVIINLILL